MTGITTSWVKRISAWALAVLIAFGAIGMGASLTPSKAYAKTGTHLVQTTKKATAKKKATKKKAIGKKKATAIALKNAGLKKSQVKHLKVTVDRKNGRKVYEVDFNYGAYEYDYEIGYYNGKILERDVEYDLD